jgi:hypothetical protein
MKMNLFLSLFSLLPTLFIAACGEDGNEQDPCDGVTCSGHGTCVVDGDSASCDCNDGYHADGLRCVADDDPCDGVTCSGHGDCVVEGTEAGCDCDDGYHAQELECVADADPCDGVTCSGHGTCEVEGTEARCECNYGYHAEGLECVEDLQPGTATVVGTDILAAAGGQDRINIRVMTHGDDLDDYDFIVAKNPTVGPVIVLGPGVTAQSLGNADDYHDVNEAPADSYQADEGNDLVIGTSWRDGGSGSTGFYMTDNVYILKLDGNTYGKIEVLSAKQGKIDVMCYHQPDGSANIATEPE